MSTPPDDLIPLAQLPRELRTVAPNATASALARASYKALYSKVLDGALPAERVGGRWFFRRAGLDALASTLGLTAAKSASKPRASSPSSAAAAA